MKRLKIPLPIYKYKKYQKIKSYKRYEKIKRLQIYAYVLERFES